MAFEYPKTKREDIVEEIHGRKIEDPYRWLEDAESPDVQKWVDKQNELTNEVLKKYPGSKKIASRLRELYFYDNILDGSLGVRKTERGVRFFYLYRKAAQQQPTLCYQDGETGHRVVLFDPIIESEEGLLSIDWYYPSFDGSFIAFGISEAGTEMSTLQVMDVEKKTLLKDRIPRTKWCSLRWIDNIGFYYSRYPLPNTVSAEDEHYYHHVYYHRLGDDYHRDVKVFGEGRPKTEHPLLYMNDDSTLLAVLSERFVSSDIHIARVDNRNPGSLDFKALIESDSFSSCPGFHQDYVYVNTQIDAPNGQILRYDLSGFKEGGTIPEPKLVVEEGEGVIFSQANPSRFKVFGDSIAVVEDKNASSYLKIYDVGSGNLVDDIDFETYVTLFQVESAAGLDGLYYSLASFFSPTTYYRYKEGESHIVHRADLSLIPDDFRSEFIWFDSKDGTKVSMFLLSKNGAEISEETPILLTGYGGFGIGMSPFYQPPIVMWVENGGVLAIPHLRGGGEYGHQWHRAGNRENKQNVFDDFISAAEWLTENRVGGRDSLAISGGSNGGLLVGAALVQRPDLLKAVVCGVPLLDMIRYTNFQVAKTWATEYGDPEVREEFEWLYTYSPYHHVKEGERYPATLLHTALGDTRVDPMHAFKMAARLQASSRAPIEEAPIILHTESKAGHGAGRSLEKTVDLQTRLILFMAHHTGLGFD